mmetsp:Transcript_21888/g.33977  ORF Transcript_21888/g.33977 Transcript_21888/m.33977 type:complete len:142 (+) Transcript_21888:404-829(+)
MHGKQKEILTKTSLISDIGVHHSQLTTNINSFIESAKERQKANEDVKQKMLEWLTSREGFSAHLRRGWAQQTILFDRSLPVTWKTYQFYNRDKVNEMRFEKEIKSSLVERARYISYCFGERDENQIMRINQPIYGFEIVKD